MEKLEAYTQKKVLEKKNLQYRVDGDIITLPVVVHVIYNTSIQNISDAQILSQIEVINEDFRRTNSDADNKWSQAADTEIEFALATIDPNGNTTTGITRTYSSRTSWPYEGNLMKSSSSGGVDPWDTSAYLNMWVCPLESGLLGYAQFPGGDADTDGVVMSPQYFGSSDKGTGFYLSAPFDKGRTTTHEIGHFLNLRHIWGDGACGVDDFVTDTPSSDAANYGCDDTHTSCGSLDMVENFMDYTDDSCMNLFTQGQKDRMRTVLEAGGLRRSLALSDPFGTGVAPTCTDGVQNGDETGVDCGGSSCAPCVVTCESEGAYTLDITFDNYPEETSWTVTSGGSTVASASYSTANADGSSVTETFTLTSGDYEFTINDAYGDGICCSYGSGSYSLSSPDGVVVSGGSFGSSETTTFCVDGGGTSVFPDPSKKYYIDSSVFNYRLAATGESEDAYTTSQTTTGDDVEWVFVDKGNGYWHIDRAAGGSLPRLRTDNSADADMQGTAWTGIYTYYDLTEGNSEGTYYVTLPDGPDSYKRLQITNGGEVKMVATNKTGSWVSFVFTEVSDSSKVIEGSTTRTIEEVSDLLKVYPNPIKAGTPLKISSDNLDLSSTSYKVISVLGRVLDQGTIGDQGTISTDKLKAGMYILNMKDSNTEANKQFIVR